MSTQLLKTYTPAELEALCKEYKFLCIENSAGERIHPWNSLKVPIKEHYKACIKRLNHHLIPDGFYYFCFSSVMRNNKKPDRYLTAKGNPPVNESPLGHVPNGNTNDLITTQAALNYITQIAEYKVKNTLLERDNETMKNRIVVLEAQLKEWEDEYDDDDDLADGGDTSKNIMEYLKEAKPMFSSFADRYFNQQDKKLELEKQRIELQKNKEPRVKKLVVGSPEHLAFIRMLDNAGKDDELENELDKLEAEKPEIYKDICADLGFEITENDLENPEKNEPTD